MPSISSALFARRTTDKIVALATGLAACSLALCVAVWVELPALTPAIQIDDSLFGVRTPGIVGFFLLDAALMLTFALRAGTASPALLLVVLLWTAFLFVEGLADLVTFRADPWLLAEESVFLVLYAVLLSLLLVQYRRSLLKSPR
jgi:hypothetical protein